MSTKASWIRPARHTRRRSSSSPTTHRSDRTTSCSRKSMTGPVPKRKSRSRLVALSAAAVAATMMACGPVSYEIPIETPIQPKLDVTAFQRVLIAGFVAGGTDDVDTNQETVRLLRSQLRSKSSLRVIDADVMQLLEIAQEQSRATGAAVADASSATARESGAPQ